MFTKRAFSFVAVLMLFAAGGGAHAAPARTAFDAAEAGIPDSVDYANRMAGGRSPSTDEINAAESGNPDSVDDKDQQRALSDDGWRAAWEALESDHPDFG